jgi:hypothetical protein
LCSPMVIDNFIKSIRSEKKIIQTKPSAAVHFFLNLLLSLQSLC